MQTAGIVAEYNPFHRGHAWHIAETRRRLGGDAPVVCVMSGHWVQRGECALTDKWRRAALALSGGADLVVELPTPWSMASAESFARGAVSLLAATGVVDVLSFGKNEMAAFRGSEVAMIFQNPMTCLNPVYTVGNQLIEALRAHDKQISKDDAAKRAMEMLELVGINNVEKRMKQYPHEFSGGMRQRVMIAMGLICHPKLLIADEPTTALDVTIQAQILELMKSLQKKTHMGIIFITHNLGVVAEICDKVSVMYAGKMVEQGPVDDIFYKPGHPYTMGLLRSMPRVDAESYERLIPIEGTPVDMLNPPEGCPFAPRCEHAMKVCLQKMPPYVELGEGHRSACWLRVQEQMAKEKAGQADATPAAGTENKEAGDHE